MLKTKPHNFLKRKYNGIGDYINCDLAFLFLYVIKMDGFLLHKIRPLKGQNLWVHCFFHEDMQSVLIHYYLDF